MADYRDVAAWMEAHPTDLRRGCSTIVTPYGNAKCIQNCVELGAAMARAAKREWERA